MIRIRITFAKTDLIRYIGHLDIHHIWIRTFRRAHIQVTHSQGYHPLPRIQMASALSLGYTGSRELLECWLDQGDLSVEEIKQRLLPVMHPGLRLLEVEPVDLQEKPLQVRICGAIYQASLPESVLPGLPKKIADILSRPAILVERKGKQVDIRRFIYSLDLDHTNASLRLHLSAGEAATGRVDEILHLLGIDPLDCLVDRTSIELRGKFQT